MKRKLFVGLCLVVVCIFSLASCGKAVAKEYKTPHESGTYIVRNFNDIEKLLFKQNTLPDEIAGIIPDFCIYEKDEGYQAKVPIDMSQFIKDNAIIRVYEGKTYAEDLNEWWYSSLNYEDVPADKYGDVPFPNPFYIVLSFNADKEFKKWEGSYRLSKNNPLSVVEVLKSTFTSKYGSGDSKDEYLRDINTILRNEYKSKFLCGYYSYNLSIISDDDGTQYIWWWP